MRFKSILMIHFLLINEMKTKSMWMKMRICKKRLSPRDIFVVV